MLIQDRLLLGFRVQVLGLLSVRFCWLVERVLLLRVSLLLFCVIDSGFSSMLLVVCRLLCMLEKLELVRQQLFNRLVFSMCDLLRWGCWVLGLLLMLLSCSCVCQCGWVLLLVQVDSVKRVERFSIVVWIRWVMVVFCVV